MPVMHAQPDPPTDIPAPELHRILRLRVPIIVKLAERKLNVHEVMRLGTGAIIEFFKSSDEPLELLINNKVIGVGEAVKVGENFGLRLTQVGDVGQVIKALGSAGGSDSRA
jgi:flagellar motor switch protein FliN